jgi:hypothetical protein
MFSIFVRKWPSMSHCSFWYRQHRSFDLCCHVFSYFSETAISHNPYTTYSSLLSWNHYSKQLQKGDKNCVTYYRCIALLFSAEYLGRFWTVRVQSSLISGKRYMLKLLFSRWQMLYLNLFKKNGGGGIWGYWAKTFIWCKSWNKFVCRLQPIFGC